MGLVKQNTAVVKVYNLGASLTTVTCAGLSKAGGAFAAASDGTVVSLGNGWYSVSLDATDTNTLGDLAVDFAAVVGVPVDPAADQVVLTIPGENVTLTSAYDAAKTAMQEGGDVGDVTGDVTGDVFGDVLGTVTLDDGPHGGSAAVLTLERVVVASTTTDEPAIKTTGNGAGAGLEIAGGDDTATPGPGVRIVGGTDGSNMTTGGAGMLITGGGGSPQGPGMLITGHYAFRCAGTSGSQVTLGDDSMGLTIAGNGGSTALSITATDLGTAVVITGGSHTTTPGAGVVVTGGAATAGDVDGASAVRFVGGAGFGAGVQGLDFDAALSEFTAAALAQFFTLDTTDAYAYAVAGSVVKEIADNAGGSSLTTADITDAVWDEALSGHTTGGSAGKAVSDTLAAVDTEVAAIKAKTDNLPSDPADASDIASAFSTVNSALTIIAGYIDTEVAAIKAKTDNLPASPAAVADIPTANANADALLDRANAVESSVTVRKALRLLAAALGGKLSISGSTVTIRDLADSKDRVTATTDTDGQRTAVTLDLT